MVFKIDRAFAENISSAERSELYSNIISHGHYADCDEDVRNLFYADIENNGSTIQREFVKKDPSLKLTTRMRTFLTEIIVSDYTGAQLNTLICKPAKLMVENESYERPVYKCIISAYAKSDKRYKNIFRKLYKVLLDDMLAFQHGGGYSTYVSLLEIYNQRDYKDVAAKKFCSLVDRDTDNSTDFDAHKKTYFQAMCGKESYEITNEDIYTLTQSPNIWHMWFRRTIENYIPDEQYKRLNVQLDTMPANPQDRNYKKLSEMSGYAKHKLPDLVERMSYADFEHGLMHFQCGGEDVSEMQLFLLKLVRII
ncbi:MAG: hypothetical protein J1E57_10470 [Prevotella sp.]|nr:hypothetical protein [Prevotella sp.]